MACTYGCDCRAHPVVCALTVTGVFQRPAMTGTPATRGVTDSRKRSPFRELSGRGASSQVPRQRKSPYGEASEAGVA
jgi:hypothetical protein